MWHAIFILLNESYSTILDNLVFFACTTYNPREWQFTIERPRRHALNQYCGNDQIGI